MKQRGRSSFLMLLLCLIIVFVSWSTQRTNNVAFTTQQWNEEIGQREKMLESLLQTHDLIGMTKEEIKVLLGTNGMVEPVGGGVLQYYIADGYIDPVLLFIELDAKGRVSHYFVCEG